MLRLLISRTGMKSMKDMVYFSFGLISLSFLYQVILISGDPLILHSQRTESPCFITLADSNFLINFGGSIKPKGEKIIRILFVNNVTRHLNLKKRGGYRCILLPSQLAQKS